MGFYSVPLFFAPRVVACPPHFSRFQAQPSIRLSASHFSVQNFHRLMPSGGLSQSRQH